MIQTIQQLYPSLKGAELILFIIFFVLYMVRLLYLFLFTGRVLFKKKDIDEKVDLSPLSLIITVRNEEENLKNNLPTLLTIDGVDYEVVVVDDFSQDNSYLVLGAYKNQYRRLKISSLNQETRFSSKLSQNIAIKATAYEWVLSVPVSLTEPKTEWLSSIVQQLTQKNDVVIGYTSIENTDGFFNRLYRTTNYWLFMKSSGYISNGLSLVYSDENVAFRKQKYFDLGGYGTMIKEPFANLELLINNFIRKKSTVILFNPESTVRKKQEVQWIDYLDLLKKSFRLEKHFVAKKRFFLAVDELTKLFFLIFSILVIALLPELWIVYLVMFVLKTASHLLIIKRTQNRLKEPKIFISSLVYDLLMPFFNLFYKLYFNYRSRKNKWRSTA